MWSWEPVAAGCMYGEGCWRLDTRGLQIQASLTTSHLGPQLLYVYLCAMLTGEKSLNRSLVKLSQVPGGGRSIRLPTGMIEGHVT